MSAKGKAGKPLVLTVPSGDASAYKNRQRRDSLISPLSPNSPFGTANSPKISSGRSHGRNLDLFFTAVVTKPPLEYAAFANVHKLLLQDPSSISELMKKEITREPFILSFQEDALSIVDFFTKLSPFFKKNPAQNSVLAKALLEGVVMPLFVDQYQDLFFHDEMLQLISVSLRSYYDCGAFSSPGLVSQLVGKLTLSPQTRLLERFVAHPDSGDLLVMLVKEQKYGSSLFEHGHPVLVNWIDRLIDLSNCGFDHGVSASIEKWSSICQLKSAYPQPTTLTPSSEGYQSQKKVDLRSLRKLTDKDKKSGGSKKGDTGSERISVPPATAQLFKGLNSPIPKTLSEARNAVHQLELSRAFCIFEEIIGSFPCSNCCKISLKDGSVAQYPGKYLGDTTVTDTLDLEECRVSGAQVHRMELKHLGLWRIVLSRQAMKDFGDSRRSGKFAAVESKLRELATGNWGQRKALTKKHINPDFPIPIKKAVYDDNGRIIWHVHLSFDQTVNRASQVILVWRIGDHKEVVQSEAVIKRHQKTFRSDFVDACKLRIKDPSTGTYLPQTFGMAVLDQEQVGDTLSREESLDLHNAIITGKFYTLTQTVLDGILTSGSSAEFPFDVAHDEVEIIRQESSASFILGRSGTGKTTCLAFKLLSSYIGSRANIEGGLSPDAKPVRQIFITRSEILAGKLNGYIRRLINCQLGRFESDDIENAGLEVLKEKDDDGEARDLWSLTDEDFPLVCTFDKLLTMVETSIKKGGRKFWDQTTIQSPSVSSGSGLTARVPREVDAQTFIDHYWSKFPASVKKNIQVDLVFSEIMGIIKGSTSALPGRSLKALTRDDYLKKSCRVAPLFTSETERQQVYAIYEAYEKLKAENRDWDGVDRTREVFVAMQENPALARRLREVVEEVYVDEIQDQRLLEIEFLLTMVRFPRGVHLAGDSAQCISRDSTFRFSDIKALFFEVFGETATAMNQSSLAKPKEFRLAHNYRSHQGIIALGALLIESLWNGFPDMIDKLRPEIGKYTGPKPTFFAGFRAEDVLVSQAFGVVDLYDQLADFGADQVILVRDEEVQKQVHSRIGSEVLILTVLQSKGMEFEDVVLLNFFSASSYLASYRALDRLIDKKYGEFDRKKHSILCAELKTLYVAVTRCRANLRIVEENKATAELIVDFWTNKVSKPLIDTVRPNDEDAAAKIKALRSGSSGNPALWLKNGQHLMEKKLYKQALFCFSKTPYKQRQIHARAHIQRQEAETLYASSNMKTLTAQSFSLFRESANSFLEADHPMEASRSLEAAGLFEEAADMWLKRQKPEKAAPLYEMALKYSKASKTYHLAEMYTEATKSLRRGGLYEELVDYLETAKNDLDPLQYQRSSKLCNLLAHQGKLKPTYKTRTLSLLGSDLKIEMFYRQRGYTSDLLELFRLRGRTKDAFHYLTSVGKVKEAVLLAPLEQMKESIPITEIRRMQQLLLISDLRATTDGNPPDYADPSHRNAAPGMDQLWHALYRGLRYGIRVEKSIKPTDKDIDGYIDTKPYLDFMVIERIDEVLERVRDIGMLPLRSINFGLWELRALYYAKEEVPDTLRRFVGAYRQPNRSSLLVYSTSPLNNFARTLRRVSPEELLKLCTHWFTHLVLKATLTYLEKANKVWSMSRSGNLCVSFALTGQCKHAPPVQWGPQLGLRIKCPHNHYILNPEGFQILCQAVQEQALITAKLRFFYTRTQLRPILGDHVFYENFRSRQRRWLEVLLAEVTYVSPVQQDPLAIQSAAVFHTNKEEYREYRWLCDDLGRLLQDVHAKDEWASRNTYSGLLELTQRAEQLGAKIGRQVRWTVEKNLDYALRDRRTDAHRRNAFNAFLYRPRIGRYYRMNFQIHDLKHHFSIVKALPMSEMAQLHSVLSNYERFATYLLLLEGDRDGFILLTSWIDLHIPEVGPAYHAVSKKPDARTFSSYFMPALYGAGNQADFKLKAEANQCLMQLMHNLTDLIHHLNNPEMPTMFKAGGPRGVDVPRELLIRRCFDILSICLINIRTSPSRPAPEWEQFWNNLCNYLPMFTKNLGPSLPPWLNADFSSFVRGFAGSFTIYAGKESITLIEPNNVNRRFVALKSILLEHQVQLKPLEEILAATISNSPAIADQDEESREETFSEVERTAAKTICKILKEYWPRYKRRTEWKNSSEGRSAAAIDKLCEEYRLRLSDFMSSPLGEQLYQAIWLHGPKSYEAIEAAETQGIETSDRYQTFFTSLYGTSYTDADLERVEELFEEVEAHNAKIAELKSIFTIVGMKNLWFSYRDMLFYDQEAKAESLCQHILGMQKEANSIKHSFSRLATNRYVDTIRD